MPTKPRKEANRFFDAHGFTYDHANSKGYEFFAHPAVGLVSISQTPSDQAVKHLIASLQKQLGITTAAQAKKRNVATVKKRQADERERLANDIARHDAALAELMAQRDSRMNNLGRFLTDAEVRDIENLIEKKERELRGWRQQMQEIPSVNAHAGRLRAQHRS